METNEKKIFLNTLFWGVTLWLIGYVLGIVLFPLVPAAMIGWVITPIGVIITLWILVKKIDRETFVRYVRLAVAWTMLAVALDYLFIVKLFSPAEAYYKPDVYLYYFLTLALPILVGWRKTRSRAKAGKRF
jgi:hypothetical protein